MGLNDRDSCGNTFVMLAAASMIQVKAFTVFCLRVKLAGATTWHLWQPWLTLCARWFDENGKPQLETKEWKKRLLSMFDFANENTALQVQAATAQRKLSLVQWRQCGNGGLDATSLASFVTDPKQSKVRDQVWFSLNPYRCNRKRRRTGFGHGTLAIPPQRKRRCGTEILFVGHVLKKLSACLVKRTAGLQYLQVHSQVLYANPKSKKRRFLLQARAKKH